MSRLFALLVSVSALLATTTLAEDTRLYELRIYTAAEGKLDALHARFRDYTCKSFEKHGMTNVGYWVPIENPERKLYYILSYPSKEAKDASWKAFIADADRQKFFAETEKDGKLAIKYESIMLAATDYSPEIKPAIEAKPRVFELRTYTTTPGNLKNLDARFRDHTIKLFSKHGMKHFGYWHMQAGQKGAEDTLIYILMHESADAHKKSFDAFRMDPDWIAARMASEKAAGGPLTAENGVKSILMTPTDYSQSK
jgi:hypothetical protein